MKINLYLTHLSYFIFLLMTVALYIFITAPKKPKSLDKIIEGFAGKPLSDYREDSDKLIVYPDHNDKVYTRLFELVTNEPSIYRCTI